MPRLIDGDTTLLEEKFPRELWVWQDANVDKINFFNDIVPEAESEVNPGGPAEPFVEDFIAQADENENGGDDQNRDSDSHEVEHDDQEQLLGTGEDGDVEAQQTLSRTSAPKGFPPDEIRPPPGPLDPPRDLNATRDLTYGYALGTLDRGTKNVMNSEYESLNYLTLRTALYEEYEQRTVCKKSDAWITMAGVLIAIVIGLLTGLVGAFIKYGIEVLSRPKYELFARLLNKFSTDEAATKPVALAAIASVVILAVNGALVSVSGLLGNWSLVSTGSGIPHIKAYLNGVNVPKLLRIETLSCKVMGVILSVVGGMPVGKEGPMIHSGAIVGGGISQGKTTTLKRDLNCLHYFRNDDAKRQFVACGTAAGVAAAFGAPIGGTLFNIEEGASYYPLPEVVIAFISASSSLVALSMVTMAIEGNFTFDGLFSFGTFTDDYWTIAALCIFVMMGVLGGLLGAVFNKINTLLTQYRMKHVRTFRQGMKHVMYGGLLVTAVALTSMFLIDDCMPESGRDSEVVIRLQCGEGSEHAAAAIWFATPERVLQDLYHSELNNFQVVNLAIFNVLYFAITCMTYGLRISSGIFIPSMLIGATWGRIIGYFLNTYASGIANWGPVGLYALVGSVAQLSGIVRVSFSIVVIAAEATGSFRMLIPFICATFIAQRVGEFFNEGLYDIHNGLSGVPILPWTPPVGARLMSVSEFMTSPVVCFTERVRMREVWEALCFTCHNAFPVVRYPPDQGTRPYQKRFGKLLGYVLRQDLIILLGNQCWEDNLTHGSDLIWEMFHRPYPRYGSIFDFGFHPSMYEKYLRLSQVMGIAHTIQAHEKFAEAFQRMRYQQMRHLFVVDAENEVVGIITRKDLFRFMNHMAGDVGEPKRTTTPVMTHPCFYKKSWVVVHQKPTWLPRDQHRALFGETEAESAPEDAPERVEDGTPGEHELPSVRVRLVENDTGSTSQSSD